MAPAPGLRMFVCPNSLDIPDWPLARISACEVDVFSVSTHFSLSDIGQLRTLLTDDELSRADRFRFDEHRNQYTIARGWLRLLLSGYTGRDATQLRFAYASNGKPELVSDTGEASIDFNVAHSEELIVLAFARHRRLGIDIERIRQDVAYDDLAQRYFSAAEYACLRELAPTRRANAFFACWTRKEAYVKALGYGLALPLPSFDVFLDANVPYHIMRPSFEPGVQWHIQNLEVASGYAAALALEEANSTPTTAAEVFSIS